MFGKVLDAVGTLEDAITPDFSGGAERERDLREKERERELDTLREEEEPEEGAASAGAGVTRNGSVSSSGRRDERRTSRASMSSVDSSSSFGFGFLGGRKSVEERRPEMEDEGRTPTAASPPKDVKGKGKETADQAILSSPDLDQRRGAFTGPPPVITRSNQGHGHGRSRSTFDVLSGVAGGGWGALGKKWTAVTESETFKNSKKTTIGLLDTFEQGLATALGPLDPPPLSPLSEEFVASPDPFKPSSTQSIRPTAPSRIRSTSSDPTSPANVGLTTPKQGEDFDWSAFLDGDEAAAEPHGATSPPIRGYKRPSLTPKPLKSPISPPNVGKAVLSSAKAKRLSMQSNGTAAGAAEEVYNRADSW